MNCYICDEPLHHDLSFRQLWQFKPLEFDVVCQTCRSAFVTYDNVEGCSCCGCGRAIEQESESDFLKVYSAMTGEYCYDCFRWLDVCSANLVQHQALLEYRTHVKSWIVKYKYQGDVRQAHVMKPLLQAAYRQYSHFTWCVLPSAPSSLHERGFHATATLLEVANIPYIVPFRYVGDGVKQATKTRQQRLALSQPFECDGAVLDSVSNCPLLLFDDIYTTGATLLCAKQLLQQYGVTDMMSLSVARDTLQE